MSKLQKRWLDAFYPNEKYVLILWPESQSYMDENWFKEEAVGHPTESGAYFIPESKTIDK